MAFSRSHRRRPGSNRIGNHRIVVMDGFATILGAVLIVGVGVLLAHLCAFLLRPACIYDNDASAVSRFAMDVSVPAPSNSIGLRRTDPEPAKISVAKPEPAKISVAKPEPAKISVEFKTTTKPPAPLFPEKAKFPANCSAEQFDVLAKQLSGEGCKKYADSPWRQDCSFSKATLCGTANPHWFYDFIHQSSNDGDKVDDTFRGIIVGCNKGYEAVELLRIASPASDNNKYDLEKWKGEFARVDNGEEIDSTVDCTADGKASSNTGGRLKKAQIYCIEGLPKTVKQLEKTKAALGYTDDELNFYSFVASSHYQEFYEVKTSDPIGKVKAGNYHWTEECEKVPKECSTTSTNYIDNWIKNVPDLAPKTEDPTASPLIQFLSVTAEGSDYEILKGAFQTLRRTQYIDFGYHWNFDWGNYSLKDLIFRLKKKGFVCYFTGHNGQDMWRITDCWQDHYEIKFSANIGCVNANIPAAEPLLEKMEGMFLETLKKDTEVRY
eukprot:CAMPEP_0172386648 /NCGR_PEP_ID=MMETSP1061-20121228/4120_1 /TAXON_ID=37318 /ORGANISM="Pseudo-nitzschia pungens, Strain cf. pungens" /LENGTH=493 /DNA_ID=CAMNT_0013116057 /DNA_START=95 /DNA_END=1576 /DNA_ORIENTATION=+